MKHAKIAILVLIMCLSFPMSAFASITPRPLDPNTFDVTPEEYGVVIPAGATGAFPLKTPSGSTKFMPPEAKGKDLSKFVLRFRGIMSPDFYMVTTFGDGYKLTYEEGGETGRVGINSLAFDPHRSKGVSIVLYVKKPMDKERYAKMLEFSVFESSGSGGTNPPTNPPGGGTDPPNPGGGTNPGGTNPGGTNPGGTNPGGTNPGGTDPGGTNPGDTDSGGTNPGGTDPGGMNPGGTDPGGTNGGNCNGCQAVKDALECPEFDVYLGKWADMIRGTFPPPPDWDYVATVMRDWIVPAMGDELVNRSPMIARIVADEFESREKQVSPPPYVNEFRPQVPKLYDTPRVTDSLDSNVPQFNPDYSEDKGFRIPDPDSIDFSDYKDKGYTKQKPVNTAPDYKANDLKPEPDPGYKGKEPSTAPPPDYKPGTGDTKPPPEYNRGDQGPMPGYETGEPSGAAPNYESNESNKVPAYRPGG